MLNYIIVTLNLFNPREKSPLTCFVIEKYSFKGRGRIRSFEELKPKSRVTHLGWFQKGPHPPSPFVTHT